MSTPESSGSTTAVAAEFAELGVATVYEAAGRVGLIDVPLTRVIPGSRAAGPARIAVCAQGDNRAVHAVLASAQAGDVLVLTMPDPQPVALIGELVATQAAARGVAGILVDAAVRDVDELVDVGVPVWTRHIRATGAVKNERGLIDVPVVVGTASIGPGDLVVLDGDGAAVVARHRIEEVLTASRARLEREADLRSRYLAGELSYDIYGMRAEDTRLGATGGRSASGH